MNVLLLSDIHSNITALEAVLADAESNFDIDETWVLGDMIGYGPNPNECLSLLSSLGAVMVAGNHELAVLGAIPVAQFNHNAAAAIEWTHSHLDPTHMELLKALPKRLERHGVTLVHGSLRSPEWEYLVDERIATQALIDVGTRGVAVGHTHVQAIYELDNGRVARMRIDPTESHAISGEKFLINPGSVGQPRDGNPDACYAVLNLDQPSITHQRVKYDTTPTAQRIRETGLPTFLADRLLKGI